MEYFEALKSFFSTGIGFWIGIGIIYMIIWSVWIVWQLKIAKAYYYEDRMFIKKSPNNCCNDNCKCNDPELQDETRKCGTCDSYISRVDHIDLTNKQ